MIDARLPGLSFSALFVCGAIALAARHPAYAAVFRDTDAEALFRGATRDPESVLGPAKDAAWVAAWFAHHDALHPGLATHVLYRKRLINDRALAFLEAGGDRVVMLGAGLDTLGLRLARRFPRALFVELDQPLTQALKRALLRAIGPVPPNLRFLGADLAPAGAAEWLARAVPPAPARTLVIAEGVGEYLPPAAAASLFGYMRQLSGPTGRCLFTFVSAGAQLPSLRLPRLPANLHSDPYRFRLDPAELDRFLARRALRQVFHFDPDWIGNTYLPSLPPIPPGVTPIRPLPALHFVEATSALPVF